MDESIKARILAYIMPRTATTEVEIAALDSAVAAQSEYESRPAVVQSMNMPPGMASFTVNGFSATMSASRRASLLFPAGIAPAAHAYLLNAGLLYRGVPTC